VILTAQTGVSHDIPAGKMISGSPGFDNRVWLRAVTIFQRLPELLKRLDRVEKKLAAQETAGRPNQDCAVASETSGVSPPTNPATLMRPFQRHCSYRNLRGNGFNQRLASRSHRYEG
jgi:hypothetical protein